MSTYTHLAVVANIGPQLLSKRLVGVQLLSRRLAALIACRNYWQMSIESEYLQSP